MFQTRIVQWADGVMTRFDEMALFTVKVMRPAVRPSANGTVVPVDGHTSLVAGPLVLAPANTTLGWILA